MAIFGSKKETQTESKSIRPVVVKTENVAKELVSIAASNRVNPATLDFNLLDMQTFIRTKSSNKDEMFKEVRPDELYKLEEKQALLDPGFEIKQSYEIEVLTKRPRPRYDRFHFSIGVNATMCKVFMSIKEGSFLEYSEDMEEDLIEIINKKKIRANLLVGIFDKMLEDVVSKIASTVMVQGSVVFEKSEPVIVGEGIEPEPTLDDAIIMHFQKKHQKGENDRIDYSKRNFIQSVVENEILIEYKKPKKGSAGRNCRGEFLDAREPEVNHLPAFKVSEHIATEETEEAILYKAKKSGYVVFENETYDIRDELDVDVISFKTTGSIETQLDADVSLKVKEADVFKDAIGTGMEVEIGELEVEGNIGSNAKVSAKIAKIQGQTHKTSLVNAKELSINVHKGTATGDNVHITRLEQGVVKGNTVDIAQVIGGNIKAKEVTIELLGSNSTITASKLVEIKKMQGSENKIVIDPLAVQEVDEHITQKELEIEEVGMQMHRLKKDITKYSEIIQKNKNSFLDIKKKIAHYKQNSVKIPETFIKQYKQFMKIYTHLSEITAEYEELKLKKERLMSVINTVQEDIFAARVINRDKWVGYNEIRFKLIDPPRDIVYNPIEGAENTIFALVETEEGQYVVKAVKE